MQTKHRSDIDGLRAIAVIAVIFFHLHVPGFSGGYIGVDVFFVISGYLITGMIFSEIQEKRFSLKNFYIRRIRRLVPALLTTLTATSLLVFFTLKPVEMRSFAASLIFQSVSMQNLFFLSEGEYFLGSDLKPLLHTWSLAVEEQFYLFWPLILLLICRYSFKVYLLSFTVIILSSFVFSLVLMGLSPKASFFLLPSRAWELSLGGLIALLETRDSFRRHLTYGVRTTLGVIGLAIVCFSFVYFSASTPFPGWAALLPVFGTFFLLASGVGSPTVLHRVLSLRPLVLIGLISYPMYLWHWPIIVMLRQFEVSLTLWAALFVILSTVTLSAVTYRYIESPIRSRKWFPSTKWLLYFAAAGFAVLTAFGIHTWLTDGAAYRYSAVARNFLTAPLAAQTSRCGIIFKVLNPRKQACALLANTSTKRRVLLWGNSHADHWSGLFVDLAKESGSAFYLNARNCRATPDSEFCGINIQNEIFNFIRTENISDVVLSSTGYGSYGILDDVFEKNMNDLVRKLAEVRVRVWLVIDVPIGVELNPVAAFLTNPNAPEFGVIKLNKYLKTKKREQDFFYSLSHSYSNVYVVDPSLSLCDSENCYGGKENVIWYKDSGHLTDAGAKQARPQFHPIFLQN
jgi:peptidoglycan/LPS O-acetylase OafA/YrhL